MGCKNIPGLGEFRRGNSKRTRKELEADRILAIFDLLSSLPYSGPAWPGCTSRGLVDFLLQREA